MPRVSAVEEACERFAEQPFPTFEISPPQTRGLRTEIRELIGPTHPLPYCFGVLLRGGGDGIVRFETHR